MEIDAEAVRQFVYPFGYLSSLAFFLRFLVQWWVSERAGKSIVTKSFWHISITGNVLLMLHSLIQLQFPMYLLQSQQIVLAWRNLNLMGKNPFPLTKVITLLVTTSLLATVVFFGQQQLMHPLHTYWIRTPYAQNVSPWLHGIGCIGLVAFSSRFWVQWWEAEKGKKSILSASFWWISIIGTVTTTLYFYILSDWVNIIGPACAIIPYSRNLVLLRRSKARTPSCDIVIIAGETSGDLLGKDIVTALKAKHPSLTFCGIAGQAMRSEGVKAWFRVESFQVMGLVDVIKKGPFLFLALRSTVRKILQSSPKIVITIDQPHFSCAVAKQLRAKKFSGKLIQVVAPTVWAYKPERVDTFAALYDRILLLYRFEIPYFEGKMACSWVGHPVIEALPLHLEGPKNILALFPGSRPGEIVRNLPLQLKAASLILATHPELDLAIGLAEHVSRSTLRFIHAQVKQFAPVKLIKFQDRYSLMQRAKIAITKSGTTTLELALMYVPFVCCYQLGKLTALWAKYILKIRQQWFALPNILAKGLYFPEYITQGHITPEDLQQALEPFLTGEKTIPEQTYEAIREQVDPHASPKTRICTAIEQDLV